MRHKTDQTKLNYFRGHMCFFEGSCLNYYFNMYTDPAQNHKLDILILGNVALLNLGLSDEDYTYTCSDIDLVIHAAASVNLIYPYQVNMTTR